MLDLNWLSQQAHQVHDIFSGAFYLLIGAFILVGVLSDYFKMSLGAYPTPASLIARAFVAAILLHTFPEVCNTLSDLTDAFTQKIGGLNEFQLVLSKMGDKASELAWSWTSIKDSLIMIFSLFTFFILYISVYLANAGVVFVWTLLYVFSPLLIACFVLPATSFVTKTMYRSLIEVCAWKIAWAVLAALLWSSALGHMNDEKSNLTFLTVIAYNLLLAISLVLTPFVVNSLASKGLAQTTGGWLGLAAGATTLSPGVLVKASAMRTGGRLTSATASGFQAIKKHFKKRSEAKSLHSKVSVPKVPAWHKKVPWPTEPPGWMQKRLDREKNQNRPNGQPNEQKGKK